MCYSTETRTLVDMAGYLPFFATFRVTTHEAEAFGDFNLVPTMEHGPVSLHVFFPVDNDEISHDKGVVTERDRGLAEAIDQLLASGTL